MRNEESMEDKKVYSIEEVAEILQVTRRTVYNYLKTGALKGAKIGKYWRITNKALDEFLEEGTTGSAEQ